MLNRRHIRIKVMQTIYAMQQSNSDQLVSGEKFLMNSIENLQDLYLLMLSSLIEIRKKEEEFIVLSMKKHLATEEERNPNRKFIENRFLVLLESSVSISRNIEERHLDHWHTHDHYIQMLMEEVKRSELYKSYMTSSQSSFEEDKKFVIDIFIHCIAPNEKLYDFFEDSKLTWVDDFPVVNTQLQRQFRSIRSEGQFFVVPSLYKEEEDRDFALSLFRKTVLNSRELSREFEEKTPNWDTERIAELDTIILKMGICEILKFSTIPVKVTINEYLEIAKEYSTPKSSIFINGVLDNISKQYMRDNKIVKIGKGLL